MHDDTTTDTSDYPIDDPLDPVYSKRRDHDHFITEEEIIKKINSKLPVWGILTEPLHGTLKQDDEVSEYQEYIPAAHVKFIEQTGAKVVPVSYKMSKEELYSLLD
jgi:hypothetical protein